MGGVVGIAATRDGDAPLRTASTSVPPATSAVEPAVSDSLVEPGDPVECSSPRSAGAESYVIPAGLAAGEYSLCRSTTFSQAACGEIEILDGSVIAPALVVPVVEGLTEEAAVTTLRSLGLAVSVERTELDRGDVNDGRIISQDPWAATSIEPGGEVKIVVGQATGPD